MWTRSWRFCISRNQELPFDREKGGKNTKLFWCVRAISRMRTSRFPHWQSLSEITLHHFFFKENERENQLRIQGASCFPDILLSKTVVTDKTHWTQFSSFVQTGTPIAADTQNFERNFLKASFQLQSPESQWFWRKWKDDFPFHCWDCSRIALSRTFMNFYILQRVSLETRLLHVSYFSMSHSIWG